MQIDLPSKTGMMIASVSYLLRASVANAALGYWLLQGNAVVVDREVRNGVYMTR